MSRVSATIDTLAKGAVAAQFNHQLERAMAKLEEGKQTITLTVTLEQQEESDIVSVTHKVVRKAAPPKAQGSYGFIGDGGVLEVDPGRDDKDPRQQIMFPDKQSEDKPKPGEPPSLSVRQGGKQE